MANQSQGLKFILKLDPKLWNNILILKLLFIETEAYIEVKLIK